MHKDLHGRFSASCLGRGTAEMRSLALLTACDKNLLGDRDPQVARWNQPSVSCEAAGSQLHEKVNIKTKGKKKCKNLRKDGGKKWLAVLQVFTFFFFSNNRGHQSSILSTALPYCKLSVILQRLSATLREIHSNFILGSNNSVCATRSKRSKRPNTGFRQLFTTSYLLNKEDVFGLWCRTASTLGMHSHKSHLKTHQLSKQTCNSAGVANLPLRSTEALLHPSLWALSPCKEISTTPGQTQSTNRLPSRGWDKATELQLISPNPNPGGPPTQAWHS